MKPHRGTIKKIWLFAILQKLIKAACFAGTGIKEYTLNKFNTTSKNPISSMAGTTKLSYGGYFKLEFSDSWTNMTLFSVTDSANK